MALPISCLQYAASLSLLFSRSDSTFLFSASGLLCVYSSYACKTSSWHPLRFPILKGRPRTSEHNLHIQSFYLLSTSVVRMIGCAQRYRHERFPRTRSSHPGIPRQKAGRSGTRRENSPLKVRALRLPFLAWRPFNRFGP